jgi:DNA modification methylase
MLWPDDYLNKVLQGDCLEVLRTLPDESVNCCITSPPYWGLRDYGVDGQLGLEKTPEEYVARMVEVFREVRRVLKNDGTLWMNIGDSYFSDTKGSGGQSYKQDSNAGSRYEPRRLDRTNGIKPKDLVGIPWMVAFALRSDGWYLRQDIIWAKPNPMPESVTDRCTKSHEYIFLLSKSGKYYYDAEAIKEPAAYDGRNDTMMKGSDKYADGFVPNQSPQTFHARGHERWNKDENNNYVRNRRSVWTVTTKPFSEAHFATFPPDLIKPMVLAGCPEGGIILDPFMGAGTTGMVAKQNYRNFIGIELNPAYIEMANKRIDQTLVNKKLEFK